VRWCTPPRSALLALLLPLAVAAEPPVTALEVDATATLKAGVFEPPRAAPDFTLPGTAGRDVSPRDFRGKLVVLGFGFTHCPEVCPVTLATLAAARKQLGAEADQVQVLWITVDPERDDAQRLGAYVTAFDPGFIGATGSEVQLAAVRKDYGIAASRVPQAGQPDSFSHSAFTYLIDRQGRLRALMPYGHPAADFVHDLRILLAAP
jgi:protein SCO1